MKKPIQILFCFCTFVQLSVAQTSLPYASPSEMGMDESYINHQVDSIMTLGIQEEAFPGAQVLVAKNNKIIFHKTYGYHTYDSVQPVGLDDIYDLASVTKITGPLPALMKLVDEKKLDLDAPFITYWKPWAKRKNKKDLTLRQILSHQAGLVPYIIFLEKVMKNRKIKKRFIKKKPSKRFQRQVYDDLYVKNRFRRKMYRTINRSKVSSEKKYRYSGLTFLIFPELISQLTGTDYETYLKENIYNPIGCKTIGFNPSKKDFPNKIVPAEQDTLFRKTLVKGWVHDENASLLGGVSGNAGLFATADDMAKIMLFYQNYGKVDGKQVISAETVKEFTTIQYPENENRRGLGFDKPLIGNDTLTLKDAYPAPLASKTSFGHAGFTGTFAWADPENQLVFIFLSNRVYPSRDHRKLYELNIRTALHQVFYNAFVNSAE
ncbi:serine hydrolase domain-containing protein [Flagellimonas pacifica]|uniref:CubicO group peptidase, beta-lactamase class C family n=1 Tax=Flagellimonas pacifica TaxID=1247520 RepID=A0A285MD91_9FLAO|nr:serine hydrolase [Allomuricauda parva]SNY95145.1 CubicO group peptidase, beta-lactamase class C family [Allomuricauda parva]